MTPIKIYLASGNAAKRIEIQKHLQGRLKYFELLGAESLGGMPPVEENAPEFKGNALLKARALASLAPPNAWVLADDSGLEVATLNGAPGVRSARYAGEKASSTDNLKKLLAALSNTPENERTAELVCHFALLGPRNSAQWSPNSDPTKAHNSAAKLHHPDTQTRKSAEQFSKSAAQNEPQDEHTPSHAIAEQFSKSAAQNEPQDEHTPSHAIAEQFRKSNEASEPQDEHTPSHAIAAKLHHPDTQTRKSAEQFSKSNEASEPQDNREPFKPCIEQHFEGRVSGHILNSPRGELGFGYDPVFVPESYTQSFAELGLETKNKISHRARACTMLLEWLRQLD